MDFKMRLKAARKARGMRQIDIAKTLGISQGAVTGWEVGKCEPNYATLVKMAALLGVSTDYLLGHTGGETPPPDIASAIGELADAVRSGDARIDGAKAAPPTCDVTEAMLRGTLDAARAAQKRAQNSRSDEFSAREDESHG